MAKSKKFDLANPAVLDDEDEKALTALDEGMRDAEAGRTAPAEEAHRMLAGFTRRIARSNRDTTSSTRT